jgi:CRISPR-associated protein (TIGR02584 family)
MPIIYVATLGQRPEAITVAFDRLSEQYTYAGLAVLHTDPDRSGIATAYESLLEVCKRDYPPGVARFHILSRSDQSPLIDIEDQSSAEAYHLATLKVLYAYKAEGYHVHLMIAGGRKAMSIYAMLAAALIFKPPYDKVWTVLSSEAILTQPGRFHIPPGMRQEVQLVELPLNPSRIAPGTDIDTLLTRPVSHTDQFLAKLTAAERELAELLSRHPYYSNEQLAEVMSKSAKTLENQFREIYAKMVGYFDFGETITDKRQALRDILRGAE